MDWTGEYLIRSKPPIVRRDRGNMAKSLGARKRVPDHVYIAASASGLTVKQAVERIGVSSVAIWKAARRLGISFGDGRFRRG